MTSPAFLFVVSLVALILGAYLQPHQAECDHAFYLQLRSDRCPGCFDCRLAVPSHFEARGHEKDEEYGPEWDGVAEGRIWCADGERPLIENERKAVCRQ